MDSKIIKISGSIGMVKLSNNNKNIYMFYDDHSNKKYCLTSESIFLYDLFDQVIKSNSDYVVLLEEPFINNYSNIKFLWNDTPHIIKFRSFYKKIMKKCSDFKECYVYPIDIRLLLSDVSFDEIISNLNNPEYFNGFNIKTLKYFEYLMYLFDYQIQNDIDNNNKIPDKNLLFIKKIFNKYKSDKYYEKLLNQFDNIYNNFIFPNKDLEIQQFAIKYKQEFYTFFSGFPFENSNQNNFLDQYDKLLNGIMEFYTYILIQGISNKNIIVYTGYYHSNNLTYILKKYFDYKEVYKQGQVTNINNIDDTDIINCLHIEKNIFNM